MAKWLSQQTNAWQITEGKHILDGELKILGGAGAKPYAFKRPHYSKALQYGFFFAAVGLAADIKLPTKLESLIDNLSRGKKAGEAAGVEFPGGGKDGVQIHQSFSFNDLNGAGGLVFGASAGAGFNAEGSALFAFNTKGQLFTLTSGKLELDAKLGVDAASFKLGKFLPLHKHHAPKLTPQESRQIMYPRRGNPML